MKKIFHNIIIIVEEKQFSFCRISHLKFWQKRQTFLYHQFHSEMYISWSITFLTFFHIAFIVFVVSTCNLYFTIRLLTVYFPTRGYYCLTKTAYFPLQENYLNFTIKILKEKTLRSIKHVFVFLKSKYLLRYVFMFS